MSNAITFRLSPKPVADVSNGRSGAGGHGLQEEVGHRREVENLDRSVSILVVTGGRRRDRREEPGRDRRQVEDVDGATVVDVGAHDAAVDVGVLAEGDLLGVRVAIAV